MKEGYGFPSNVALRDKQFLIRRIGSQVETIYQPELPRHEREIPSPQQTQRSEKKSWEALKPTTMSQLQKKNNNLAMLRQEEEIHSRQLTSFTALPILGVNQEITHVDRVSGRVKERASISDVWQRSVSR